MTKTVGYVQRLSSTDPYDLGLNTMKEIQIVIELFKIKSSEAVKKEAGKGNAESAISTVR
jgi:hypothetical protein